MTAEEVYAILKKQIQSGGATPEQIQAAVDAYLAENPVSGMTDEQIEQLNRATEDILKKVDISQGAENVGKILTVGLDGIVTPVEMDETLTDNTKAAPAGVVGELKGEKVNKPSENPDGINGQLLRTNGDGTTQWVDEGLPTNEQTEIAITKWLNEHPEATTTVQDESLTYKKLVVGTLGYVTPEMFGAVGDGVTDDSISIKNAIKFGKKVIFDNHKTYYIGSEITVSETDCVIDFNNCSLVFGNTITIKQNPLYTSNLDYVADSHIVGDIFVDGIFNIISEEKWSDSKKQYYLGFSSVVKNGYLENSFPYDCSGVVNYYPKMNVKILNIGDIYAKDGFEKNAFNIVGCNVEIGNVNAKEYGEMTLFQISMSKLYAHDFNICSTKQGDTIYYNYGLAIGSCSKFVLERISGISAWHVITTGLDKGVSFGGIVRDSTFVSNRDFVSYLDHENAFGTTFYNCDFDNVYTCGGKFVNCNIKNGFKIISNYYSEFSQNVIFDGCEINFPTNNQNYNIFHAEKFSSESKDYYYDSIEFKDCIINFNLSRITLFNTSLDVNGEKIHGHICNFLSFENCSFINCNSKSLFISGSTDRKIMFSNIRFEKCDFPERSIYVYLTDNYGNITSVYYVNCKITMGYVIGGKVRYYDCICENSDLDCSDTTDAVAIRCIIKNKPIYTKCVQCINTTYDAIS